MVHPTLTAQAVADLVGGRLSGNGALELRGMAPLDEAGPHDLAFLASARYLPQVAGTRAGALLVTPALADRATGPAACIVVDDPQQALLLVLPQLYPAAPPEPGIHPTAVLGAGVELGAAVTVGPRVVLGPGCRVGDHTVLGPGVVLEERVVVGGACHLGPHVTVCHGAVLGDRVTVKAGAVIGGTGFGYRSGRGGHVRVPHVGGCRIGDDVDIGANSCIDRGSIGDTVIGRGCKLDNLVHVAHNVRLGEHCLLMAGAMVAGSTRVGHRVVLAGQAGVVGHLVIGDDVRVGAQTGVTASVEAGQEVSGFPARPHRDHLRAMAALYRLAPVARQLEALVREPGDA